MGAGAFHERDKYPFGCMVSVLLLKVVGAVPARADPTVMTMTFKDLTQTFPGPPPCINVPGNTTVTYNGVMHVTAFSQGVFHFTSTGTGDFKFVPDDPTKPSYSGHFTFWFGQNNNTMNKEASFTFTIKGTGSDGSVIDLHDVAHFTMTASGAIFSFDMPRCG